MSPLIHRSALARAVCALALAVPFAARATVTLPPVHKAGAVEYLSGGIGKDQARAIEHASRNWPLTLEFAVKDKRHSDFAADVAVKVRNAKGDEVLQADATGPFLLARLAPGHYAVDATLAGKTLHDNVVVKHGETAKAMFMWPAGTDEKRG